VLARQPQALQLRYLETLTVIAADKNSTIVFPLPMDLISQLIGPGREAALPQTRTQSAGGISDSQGAIERGN
jgi:hypothetical protein